ncbi:hypothetical protein [Dyadobacter sp. CY345]|nr:hypothetical protein [Dyadobacter sp. CY345]
MKKTAAAAAKFTEAQQGGRCHHFCAAPGGHRRPGGRSLPEDEC